MRYKLPSTAQTGRQLQQAAFKKPDQHPGPGKAKHRLGIVAWRTPCRGLLDVEFVSLDKRL